MKLVGMLDSPYVRRVAVSLQLLGLRFEHQSLSVFRTFDQFGSINPVVKAPTLVCDDGTVLMDSTVILQYAHRLARPRTLVPDDPVAMRRSLHLTGLALAACEKSVQMVYERSLRPPEKLHEPWLARVTGQLLAACAEMEQALREHALAVTPDAIGQDGVDAAVAWRFVRAMVPHDVPVHDFPTLQAHSDQAEALPAFRAAPHGDSTFVWSDDEQIR